MVGRMTVLLVDDAEDVRRMYQDFLEDAGMRVVTAADGASALEAIGYESPDVIVLDLSMPRMSGWDVIKHLKQEPWTRRVPIVVLSGLDERDAALAAGANSYLPKPTLPSELLTEVRQVLSRPGGAAPRDQ
jgi:CheY-like chemotaxis protein